MKGITGLPLAAFNTHTSIQCTRSPQRSARLRALWFGIGLVAGTWLGSMAGQMPLQIADSTPLPAAAAPQPQEQAAFSADERAAPEPAVLQGPYTREVTVQNGDTLMDLLTGEGIEYQEAHQAVQAMREVYNPRRIRAGQDIALDLQRSGEAVRLQKLSMPVGVTQIIELGNKNGKFDASKIEVPLNVQMARASGTITSSLYETAAYQGLPPSLIAELIQAFSYDVDFQRDIKSGHKLDVVFEQKVTPEGAAAGHGLVKYAQLDIGRKAPITIYRYTDKDGHSEYYNEKGESIRKALLKTPVNGARISSSFGMRRHPVLGYSKMHKGLDFAAGTGTPIYAAGDGVVERANRFGGYGNYLLIKHNGTYKTAYAHVSKFAKGVRAGSRVKQGQVVAYVGSTGRSTGPHLHYEILQNGRQVNPAGVKFNTGRTLSGTELASFKAEMSQMRTQLATLPPARTEVASLR